MKTLHLTSPIAAVLAVVPQPAFAAEPLPPSAAAVQQEVADFSRRWSALEAEVGSRRARRLQHARFELQRVAGDPGRTLADDQPRAHREIRGTLRSCALKLLREDAERATRIGQALDTALAQRAARRDALRAVDGGPWHLRVSPRLGLGSSTYLGLKLRLRHREVPALERFSFAVTQRFDRDALSVTMAYQDRDRAIFLDHLSAADGDRQLSLTVRWYR